MVKEYSGVTAKVTASGTVVGWMKASFKYEHVSGDYIEIGSEIYDHTKGPKRITGTLEKAWGVDSETIFDWIDNRTVFNLEFEAVSGSSGVEKYTCSGCIITSTECNIEAGADGVLSMSLPFKGRDIYRTGP